MEKGKIYIFTGEGHGKSPAALGYALQTAISGGEAVIIQFLKGNSTKQADYLEKLEPEIKFFSFEKGEEEFDDLSEDRKRDAIVNIKNGINFARKVLSTGECDLLILDEVLGLIDNRIITVDELKEVISCKQEDTTLILTGITMCDEICAIADEVSKIQNLHFKSWTE